MQEAESGIISEEKKEANENIEALEDTLDEAENDLEKRGHLCSGRKLRRF